MERFELQPKEEEIPIKTMRDRLLWLFHPDKMKIDTEIIRELNSAYKTAQDGNPSLLRELYKKHVPKIDIRDEPRYDKPRKSYIA